MVTNKFGYFDSRKAFYELNGRVCIHDPSKSANMDHVSHFFMASLLVS